MPLRRYRLGARWYDTLSFERLLYRRGRLCGLTLAGLQPGERVLDVGCGTGLSFGPTRERIGDEGSIVGIDSSRAMLAVAETRIGRGRWNNVSVFGTDALNMPTNRFDVVLFCYSLSIVDDWRQVWSVAMERLPPGGRVVVVDTAYPTGLARLLAPLVWVLLSIGGVHPARRVWHAVDIDMADVQRRSLLAGHVRVSVGRAS